MENAVMRPIYRLAGLICFLLSPDLVNAATPNAAVTLPDTEEFVVRSEQTGNDYLIQVGFPVGYEKGDKRYPVLYLLDSNAYFGMVHSLLHLMQLAGDFKPIVIGVGYPDANKAFDLRTKDLTPADTVSQKYLDSVNWRTDAVKQTLGGADKFLAFMEKELDPIVRKKYPIEDEPGGLLGDSFGGLFSAYAFLKHSPIFDRYWIGSPGGDLTNLDIFKNFKASDRDQRVYLSLGEQELTDPFYHDIVGKHYIALVRKTSKVNDPKLTVTDRVFPGLNHMTVISSALMQALIYLYADKWPEYLDLFGGVHPIFGEEKD
tara:strand:+ start:6552 stop:7502 length:951 start_codon:yes stop_codon:yes gene_type:complete